jgi:hypothetical protein
MSSKASFRTQLAAVLLIVSIGALAGPAPARSPEEKLQRKACTADAFTLCTLQALAADRNGVRDCLMRKLDKVSSPCLAVIRSAQQKSLQEQLTASLPATAR